METGTDNFWSDDEYLPYLEAERQLYAWTLAKVGGVEPAVAIKRAIDRFCYEPMNERGSITHLGAWKIAMADLFGDHCRRPEEFGLVQEYESECQRLFHGKQT